MSELSTERELDRIEPSGEHPVARKGMFGVSGIR